MASKVLIKIPAVNFNQVGKHGADLVSSPTMCSTTVPAPSPGSVSNHSTVDPLLQVHQLEQNVRFLKEQHQIMLSALHQEIEALRNRNRDMQFQLVFSRNEAKRSPQPPEEASKPEEVLSSQQQPTTLSSPRVENLEREVAELRKSLGEARTKNGKLQEIIDEQQRKLAELAVVKVERNQPSERERSLANQLQETVQLVHRMRRFHEEQRRELTVLKGEKFRAQHAAEVEGNQVRAVKHHPCGGQPPQPQILQPPSQILQPPQQPRALPPTKSLHHHHHQAHHKIQQQQHKQQRHEQHFFPRELPPENGSPNNRFPPLPTVQNYWQNNGHSRWTAGIENSQRPPVGRLVQSMPALPAINSGTPNSARRTHYFRGGSSHQDNPDGSRKFRGKGSGGRIHRNHDE